MDFSPAGPMDGVSDRSRYNPEGVSPMDREVQIIFRKDISSRRVSRGCAVKRQQATTGVCHFIAGLRARDI